LRQAQFGQSLLQVDYPEGLQLGQRGQRLVHVGRPEQVDQRRPLSPPWNDTFDDAFTLANGHYVFFLAKQKRCWRNFFTSGSRLINSTQIRFPIPELKKKNTEYYLGICLLIKTFRRKIRVAILLRYTYFNLTFVEVAINLL
jgi:hypothetical protein